MSEHCPIHPDIALTCPRCVAVARGAKAGAVRSDRKRVAAQQNAILARAAMKVKRDAPES